jgi:hypothetical protein
MQSIMWRRPLLEALDDEIARAHDNQLNYVEVGGWAVAGENRGGNAEGLVLALAGYSLGRLRGGCLGTTTATVRHCSSAILRKIGGHSLKVDDSEIPSYFDPRYRCEMEILSFDSRRPASRYANLVDRLSERLVRVLVVAREDSAPAVSEQVAPWAAGQVPLRAARSLPVFPAALAS